MSEPNCTCSRSTDSYIPEAHEPSCYWRQAVKPPARGAERASDGRKICVCGMVDGLRRGEVCPSCGSTRRTDDGYTPVPVAPDPERDKRVAARRAEDARRAGAALDRLLAEHGEQLQDGYYYEGWRDGYEASLLHHNGHYDVSPPDRCDIAVRDPLLNCPGYAVCDRSSYACGGNLGPLRGRCDLPAGHEGPC